MTEDLLARLEAALQDRYRIERPLGAGGMATVYLAEDLKHRRQVAVKVVKPEVAAALGPDRFLREIEITAHLNHPHILPLLDSGASEGILYYVMPYIEGESLRKRLLRDRQLPLDEAVEIARQIAGALEYAHQEGIIHRDIKPENILLHRGEAVVADFGIAFAVTSAGGERLTGTGISLGTPEYMSPEQATGEHEVGSQSDVYSLGAVLYEMLTGEPPYTAATSQAIIAKLITERPVRPRTIRETVTSSLDGVVMRALAKAPADRFATAGELDAALGEILTQQVDKRARRRPRTAISLAIVVVVAAVVLAVFGARAVQRTAAMRWARDYAFPRISELLDRGEVFSAWVLAHRLQDRLPSHPELEALWQTTDWVGDEPEIQFREAVILSEPPGARVSIRDYSAEDGEWIELGLTPLESVPVPRTYMRLRLEKEGFETIDGALLYFHLAPVYQLDSVGRIPSGMVRVQAGPTFLQLLGFEHLDPLPIGSYLIDRYEVTNRQFQVFVDSGGYRHPEYWTQPFEHERRELSWHEAMARFVDQTGRSGPATWEAGHYPAGHGDLPVGGVSWYEAAAYAEFVGKSLPSIYHWARAAEALAGAWIVPHSNLVGDRLAPVGTYTGMGPYGTFDMAGNVREWCANASGDRRYILGGGWNDELYGFNGAYAQSALDRSPTNGIRLVRYGDDAGLDDALRPIDWPARDFTQEHPVSDEVFAVYRRLYDYDPTPLNDVVEERDSSGAEWIRERIAFDAAYGERMFAYLFLPKRGRPPFQTILYFPGSGAIDMRQSSSLDGMQHVEFLLRSGRAVIYPIYKSTYERGDSLNTDFPDESNFYKQHMIMWVKDAMRSLDYLETRPEIDTTRIAFFGHSWGGTNGLLIPAVEPRIKVNVLYVAGLIMQRAQPEVELIHYIPRITIPVLMLNGEYDSFFPKESAQRPAFELLGTPPDQKRWIAYPGGHSVPRASLIAETLDWLDQWLGPVQR